VDRKYRISPLIHILNSAIKMLEREKRGEEEAEGEKKMTAKRNKTSKSNC
jgi:hypothetical protein